MKWKKQAKYIVDVLMTIALLFSMAFQITGNRLHEWIGIAELLLFAVHNLLNIKFYTALFKGRYTSLRIIKTVINFCILAAMLCLGFSGIVMSRYVFAPLAANGLMATARSMHMAASYAGFILMSLHIGLHWNLVIGRVKATCKGKKTSAGIKWCARISAAILSTYGLYSFIKADIISYIFLKNRFVFFDFEKSAIAVFAEYISMMSFFVLVAYYTAKVISMIEKNRRKKAFI